MNNLGKQLSFSDREVDDQQQSNDDLCLVSGGSGEVFPAIVSGDSSTRRNRNDIGLAARLMDLFVGDGDRDNDLLMQRNTQEGTVVQWLEALDMQVMGACRVGERLKPLLKLNVSSVAEDRLLSHLSQHFEPSEVGLLARCLCIPLVSIRVDKSTNKGIVLSQPVQGSGDSEPCSSQPYGNLGLKYPELFGIRQGNKVGNARKVVEASPN